MILWSSCMTMESIVGLELCTPLGKEAKCSMFFAFFVCHDFRRTVCGCSIAIKQFEFRNNYDILDREDL